MHAAYAEGLPATKHIVRRPATRLRPVTDRPGLHLVPLVMLLTASVPVHLSYSQAARSVASVDNATSDNGDTNGLKSSLLQPSFRPLI